MLTFGNYYIDRDATSEIKMYGVTDIPISSLSVIYDEETYCLPNEKNDDCMERLCEDSFELIRDDDDDVTGGSSIICRIPFKRNRVCLTESPLVRNNK